MSSRSKSPNSYVRSILAYGRALEQEQLNVKRRPLSEGFFRLESSSTCLRCLEQYLHKASKEIIKLPVYGVGYGFAVKKAIGRKVW